MNLYAVARQSIDWKESDGEHNRVSFDTRIPLLTLDEAEKLANYLESDSKDYFYVIKPRHPEIFRKES